MMPFASRDLRKAFETPRLLTITQDGYGNSALIYGAYEEEDY